MYLKNEKDLKKTLTFFLLEPSKACYILVLSIISILVFFLTWAFFAPIDDTIKATVILRPSQAVSSVKCVTNGQVYSKNFINDDIVKEGDLLFTLDTSVYQTELESYNIELKNNENEKFINEIFLKTIETETLPDLPENSDAFVKSAGYISELKRYETSINDTKNKLEREKLKPDSLIIPQNIIDLQNQLSQNELLFESWKNNQKFQALETKKSLSSTANSIGSQISELDRTIKNSTIYAPISGRISEITKLNIGDYLLAGEEILRIVPQNEDTLKADIYVDPSFVARLKVGNPVKIKFPGLPPSRYGQLETEVSIVPPDVTYLNGAAVFIVEAKIENPYLKTKNGQTVKLLPGISAEGRIVTDRSTVMQMFLRKLDFIN